MNYTPAPLIASHRIARFVCWALTLLTWLALVLLMETARPHRRRCPRAALARVNRCLRTLAIVRGAEIFGLTRPRPLLWLRDCARPGFRRRTARGGSRRAICGHRLRKAVRHRELGEHLRRLAAAFAGIDAFARRYLVPRAEHGLHKLWPLIIVQPAADALGGVAAPAPTAADSS